MEKSSLSYFKTLWLRLAAAVLLSTAFFAYAILKPAFGIEAPLDIYTSAMLFSSLYLAVLIAFSFDKNTDNISLLFLAAATAALLYLRLSMLGYRSGDYNSFLNPWIEQMKALSVKEALCEKIGDYNMPYLYFLLIVSRLKGFSLIHIKWLSCLFDFVGAYFVMKIVGLKSKSVVARYFSFIIAAALPTVFLNSAYWGQCDSIVCAFSVMSLYFALCGKGVGSVVSYALAFSIKLQAIFVLPALIVCFIVKKIKPWTAALFPSTFFATLLPALLAGRSFWDCVRIYFDQTEQYPRLTLNAPTLWQLLGNFNFDYFSSVGVMLGGIAAISLIYISYKYKNGIDNAAIIEIFFISALLIPFLLPRMHERYFYIADILSLLIFFNDKKKWYVPLVTVFASLNAYLAYLSGNTLVPQSWAALGLLVIIILSVKNLLERIKGDETPRKAA